MSRRNEKLYHVYHGIIARCENPKNPKFNLYGGKGIEICDLWRNNYDEFKRWSIDNGYYNIPRPSIDRIDSNKGYYPDNCRWVSLSENSAKANVGRHKHKSKKYISVVYPNGNKERIYNISEFCRKHDLNRPCVSHRINGIVKNMSYKEFTFLVEDIEDVTTIENIAKKKDFSEEVSRVGNTPEAEG